MTNVYNVELEGSRIQSQLGKGKRYDAKSTEVNQLIVCKVQKINYLYNTVDVIAKDKGDSYIKSTETEGRYSARLPVGFGGALSNGMSYGETKPINLGDEVLIGFVRGSLNAPIVLGIYKSNAVALDLSPSPTDPSLVSGSPENPERFDLLFTHGTVYPSQTASFVTGMGGIERTFQGKAFLKISTDREAQAEVNDHLYKYEDLDFVMKRNEDIREPLDTAVPNILFQVPWSGITSSRTNIFFRDGLLRLSNLDINNSKNTMFYMNRSGTIGLQQLTKGTNPDFDQEGYELADDEVVPDSVFVGIKEGRPLIKTPNFSLELVGEDLILNGKTLTEMLNEYTEELEKVIEELTKTVLELTQIVSQIDIEELAEMQKNVQELLVLVEPFAEEIRTVKADLATLDTKFTTFTETLTVWQTGIEQGIATLNNEIVTARGQEPTLVSRLDNSDRKLATANENIIALQGKVISTESSTLFPSGSNTELALKYYRVGKSVTATLEGYISYDDAKFAITDSTLVPRNTMLTAITLRNLETNGYETGYLEWNGNTLDVVLPNGVPTSGYQVNDHFTYLV